MSASDAQPGLPAFQLEVVTGRPVGSPLPADTGPAGTVNAVAFSPDGKLLATADSDNDAKGTVRLGPAGCQKSAYLVNCDDDRASRTAS
jgi:WD40 repeat protein